MRVYKGKIVTLSKNPDQNGNCRIREDNEEFSWNTRWFEDPEEENRQAEREKEKQRRQEREEEQRRQKEQEAQARRRETETQAREEKKIKEEEPPVEISISGTIKTGVKFAAKPADKIAICCSDGKIQEAVDVLLGEIFPNEKKIDFYNVPGGAGQFNMFRSALYVDYESHLEDVKLLVIEHGIKTAVLIAHEHCLFYKKKLPEANETQIFNEQVKDLKSAGAKLREISKEIKIILAYAQVDENSGEIFFQMIDS